MRKSAQGDGLGKLARCKAIDATRVAPNPVEMRHGTARQGDIRKALLGGGQGARSPRVVATGHITQGIGTDLGLVLSLQLH